MQIDIIGVPIDLGYLLEFGGVSNEQGAAADKTRARDRADSETCSVTCPCSNQLVIGRRNRGEARVSI